MVPAAGTAALRAGSSEAGETPALRPGSQKLEVPKAGGSPALLPTASRQHFVSEAAPAGGTPGLPAAGTAALRAGSPEVGETPALRTGPSESGGTKFEPSHVGCYEVQEGEALRAACLAGALVFVVAFWFDGGLFKLPTAALFWVLLELGADKSIKKVKGTR